MAVAHTATGSRASGTTTITPAYPSGVAANRLAIAHRAVKPETATAADESGWTPQLNVTGGTGVSGSDTGPTRIKIDTRVLTGSESGTVSFDQGSTPNQVTGAISIYECGTGVWSITVISGDDATHGAGRTATSSSTALQVGDVVVVCLASDTDAVNSISSPSITGSVATFGATSTRLAHAGSSANNDVGSSVFEATVTGAGTGTITFTASGITNSCGPTAFVILREVVTTVQATLAAALGGLTATASGVPKHPATLTAALGALTATADATVTEGVVTHQAVLDGPLGGLTAAAGASVTHPATLAGPLGGLAAAATAGVTHAATLTAPLGALTGAAAATTAHPATLAAPLGELTAGASATPAHPAVMSAALGGMVATLAATVEQATTADAPLGGLDAQLAATVTHAAVLQTILGGLAATMTAAPVVGPGPDPNPYLRTYTLTAQTIAATAAVATYRKTQATGHEPAAVTTHHTDSRHTYRSR